MRHAPWIVGLVLLLAGGPLARGAEPGAGSTLSPDHWLVLSPVEAGGRAPFNPSTLFARYLAQPEAPMPEAGDVVRGLGGRESAWLSIGKGPKGTFGGGRYVAAYAALDAPEEGVWIARIRNASVLYVNGVPHAGDVYGYGIGQVPVALRKGPNRLFAAGFRGAFAITFEPPTAPLLLGGIDDTFPSAVRGTLLRAAAGVTVLNATNEPMPARPVEATLDPGDAAPSWRVAGRIPPLPPLGSAKVPVDLGWRRIPEGVEQVAFRVRARGADAGASLHARMLGVRDPGDAHRRTFRSGVDGSVQYYGVRAPTGPSAAGTETGLVLTLHGASVEADGQARAYGPKPDFWIVAPTNRRPFGFDWQDWGRKDAYEVLAEALVVSGVDRRHVHLTGHSMGGHGTWHLAVNDPDGFASIAPSAGWASFDTYGARPGGALRELWHRADAASLTHRWVRNLAGLPIHALHGTEDDNVPASEARQMEALLKPFHDAHAFTYVDGKGHWWDGDPAPGAACVDWPAFFEMFRSARIPDTVDAFDVAFPDLSLDATHHWIHVQQPLEYGRPCRARARWDRDENLLHLDLSNVRRFVLDMRDEDPRPFVTFEDGTVWTFGEHGGDRLADGGRMAFQWDGAAFRSRPVAPPLHDKRPGRMGPFKRVFDRHFVLVYGTAGTPEENATTLAKARYDAEQWRVRANGLAVCLADTEYLERAEAYRGRNVILYGNADTHAAWRAVVPDACPIVPTRGSVRAGAKTWDGDDLAVLLAYPKRGDPEALVGIIAASGVPGQRLLYRTPYFVSGVGLPDYVVFTSEVLARGDEGVRTAGFFDRRWHLAP